MSSRIEHSCDRCGESWFKDAEPQRQVWRVQINMGCMPYTPSVHGNVKSPVEWCRPCMAHVGLVGQTKDEKKAAPAEVFPSLGDQLEAIVREIVDEQVDE